MSVTSYKCPNCGAEIKFDPELQKGKCDFCLSEFTIDEIEKIYYKNALSFLIDTLK